ncbi:MAG: TolC family protein [Reichenbachiella sp.]|uniref:TolC family protein n=1 Tax=Reichenbachiella sp. TaxID=2184521 RepID=UPI003266EEB4
MNKVIVFCLVILFGSPGFGQSGEEVLKLEEFYSLVKQHHPMARQAELIVQRGEVAVQQARGAFDPKLVSTYDTKQFQGKDYYDIWDTYVKIPTLLNVDLKAGYERNNGLFLNPENNVPADGLYYAGISVPIGRGMIHNTRTIGLKMGKVEQRTLQNEAYAVYNNLLLDANYIYWHWFETFQKMRIAESNLDLITERFMGIRSGALNGENATIDSVEALIQVQTWMNTLEKSKMEYQNAILQMQNFIWDPETTVEQAQPDAVWNNDEVLVVDNYVDFAMRNHPDLNTLEAKLNGLELNRRLAAENIKPVLNLNYNFITGGDTTDESLTGVTNNYKGGVEFSFPLFIRKERAKLKQTKLKLLEGDLKLSHKTREVTNKVFQSYGKMIVLRNMIIQQYQIIENYETMLEGEKTKFDNGESSIFLINSRENKKISAELKLVELQAEYGRALGLTNWSSSFYINDLVTQVP